MMEKVRILVVEDERIEIYQFLESLTENLSKSTRRLHLVQFPYE